VRQTSMITVIYESRRDRHFPLQWLISADHWIYWQLKMTEYFFNFDSFIAKKRSILEC